MEPERLEDAIDYMLQSDAIPLTTPEQTLCFGEGKNTPFKCGYDFPVCRPDQCLLRNREHCGQSILCPVFQLIQEEAETHRLLFVASGVDERGKMLYDSARRVVDWADKDGRSEEAAIFTVIAIFGIITPKVSSKHSPERFQGSGLATCATRKLKL